MVRPVNNSNTNNIHSNTVAVKETNIENNSIMTQINGANKVSETSVQEIKKSIQQKKNRIEHLKKKMAPEKSAVIKKAAPVAGGAVLGEIAVAGFYTQGGIKAVLTLAGLGTIGVAAVAGIAIGYFAGKAIANYHENKCKKEIETLEQEVQILEQQLKATTIEI